MKKYPRNPNIFEKFLLIVGIFILIVGYGFIQRALNINQTNHWLFLQSIFLWLMLVVLIILLAVNENMKEELKLIQEEQLEEIRVLRKEEKTEIDIEEKELDLLKKLERKKKKL